PAVPRPTYRKGCAAAPDDALRVVDQDRFYGGRADIDAEMHGRSGRARNEGVRRHLQMVCSTRLLAARRMANADRPRNLWSVSPSWPWAAGAYPGRGCRTPTGIPAGDESAGGEGSSPTE